MKKVAASLLMVVFVSSSAWAGTVQFTSANPTIDIFAPGPVKFDVSLISGTGGFDAVDVVIGSDLPIGGFAYSSAAQLALVNRTPPQVGGIGVYPNEVFVSANNPSAVVSGLVLGELALNPPAVPLTPADMGRVFNVFVDASLDGFSGLTLRGVGDPLTGSALVTVVPEPATLSLLALGLLGFLRRRFAA